LDGSSEPVTLRNATTVLLSIATLTVACVDLSAPKGPASISAVRLPAAFVVRGDVMRDSTGTPAMPIVNQFDAAGHPFGGVAAQFFITDSAPVAHFDPTTGALIGDKLGVVHFIGQVGSLQTPSVTVPVTVAPVSIVIGTGAQDTIRPPLSQDTAIVGQSTIPVIVRGVGDTTVQGVVVRYALTRTLASNSTAHPAVFFTDGHGNPRPSVDTTNSSGSTGTVQITVRGSLLADAAVATGQKVDSIAVQASASYKGTPLTGSPITLVFRVKGTLGPP
jgi:hypothetical protein